MEMNKYVKISRIKVRTRTLLIKPEGFTLIPC